MHIGVAAPISINQLKPLLENFQGTLPPGLGGIAVNNIISGLWQRGHSLSVFALDRSLATPEVVQGERLKVYICPYRDRALHRTKDFFKVERASLVKCMREDHAEIIHAHWTYEFALAAIETGKPTLITCHDSPLKVLYYIPNAYRLVKLLMALWVFKTGENFTTVSPYMQKELRPLVARPVTVIPNLISESWVNNSSKKRIEKTSFQIISVMNGWGSIKNPKILFKAFNEVRKVIPEVTLHLYGDDFGEGQIANRWAANHDLARGVTFHGYTPSSVLQQKLREYDLLVHTSLEESFGMILVEAMASKVPVIAGRNSGAVPWILDNGRAGELIDVRSAKKLSDAIIRYLTNPTLSQERIEMGFNNVTHRFRPEKVLPLYEDCYESVIAKIP